MLDNQKKAWEKTVDKFKDLLKSRNFERIVDLWIEVCQDPQQDRLNKKLERLIRPYQNNVGYVIYNYYEECGIDKIRSLLDNNLDLVISCILKTAPVNKRSKLLLFFKNLYKQGYRSEKLIGLLIYKKCIDNDFEKCLRILNKEYKSGKQKMVELKNLLPAFQTLLKKGHIKETAQLLENFLDCKRGNVKEKIIFKYLVEFFDPEFAFEVQEKFITDLEFLFNVDVNRFKGLILRCSATAYQNNNTQFMEVIDRVENRLQERQKPDNLDNSKFQQAIEEIKILSGEFQNYFQNKPKPSYKKMEDLKVALCISGQLRGYEDAFRTWEKYILKPLQPDIFVHTWNDAGFKEPIPSHAPRVISGKFLKVYRRAIIDNYSNSSKDSYLEFKSDYPAFCQLLNDKNRHCDFQQLSQFYQTSNIAIDNADDDFFRVMENQNKMLYKIAACNDLKNKVDRQYDLVIRIRPDLEIKNFSANWNDIYQKCYEQNTIIVDGIKSLRGYRKLGSGDVFAVGTERGIDWYSSLSKVLEFYTDKGFLNIAKYSSHETLLWHLWYGGFKIHSINLGFDFVTAKLTANELYHAFSQDINSATVKNYEREMLQALEDDIEASPK
jgi:hypothetical protein